MEYTSEQLRAAYALNLCTVSVSQTIDYADVNIMEQEYEAILNNLNLEKMPKDEALLNILKNILDVITSVNILEEQREYVDQIYQRKMTNSVWETIPSIGMIIAGITPLTLSISFICQVGIGYINYRRSKSDGVLELEKKKLELQEDELKVFSSLRRELFDAAWRLSGTYGFSDELRLTSKQIRQYDMILMDDDLVRKFERLHAIRDEFLAYPPFWYHYGNTADRIAHSSLLISEEERQQYLLVAKEAFIQFRESNRYELLRDDRIASANALELAELLDAKEEKEQICGLIDEAVRFSGKEKDILQLSALEYLNIGEREKAAYILRQLVNEQYNTVMNAQLLSGIYIYDYLNSGIPEARKNYDLLAMRVGSRHLYPLPEDSGSQAAETVFAESQRNILLEKYSTVIQQFADKYAEKFRAIIPDPSDILLLHGGETSQLYERVFSDPLKAGQYKSVLREAGIPFRIIDVLNEMFEASCRLDFISGAVREKLLSELEKAVYRHREDIGQLQGKLQDGTFELEDMDKLLDIDLVLFASDYFGELEQALLSYIDSREELLDFSIAEQNLLEFCREEGLQEPDLMAEDNKLIPVSHNERRLEYSILGKDMAEGSSAYSDYSEMLSMIREGIPRIIKADSNTQFFLREDPQFDRYFAKTHRLRRDPMLKTRTLAILDGTGATVSDLIFTTRGILTVRGQIVTKMIPYEYVARIKDGIFPGVRYVNGDIDMEELYQLICRLKEKAEPVPGTDIHIFFKGLQL